MKENSTRVIKWKVKELNYFFSRYARLTDEDIKLADEYPLEIIVNYHLNLVTDKEAEKLNTLIQHNVLLQQKVNTVEYLLNANSITDYRHFSSFMLKTYNINVKENKL